MQNRRKRRPWLRLGALAAATAILLAQLPPAGPAAAEPAVQVSGELAEWVATAGAEDLTTVIVTFHDPAEVDLIDSYQATAAKLEIGRAHV